MGEEENLSSDLVRDKYINPLEEKVREMFSDESSGHDINHLKRTLNIAQHLQAREGGDIMVISAATLLHDIHRLTEKKTGQFCAPKDTLPTIREMLENVGFPKEKIDQVLHCVEYHEEYGFSSTGKTVDDIETLILQDADNLDAIGAIGIGRTFSFGGSHGLPMWDPEKPFDREVYEESTNDPSTIHHFYSKLLKLKDNMNTQTGKEMAEGRHNFMKLFLDHFFKEWQGEI